MATTGHESESINVAGLKASLQKLKTDVIDAGLAGKVDNATATALTTRIGNIEAIIGDASSPDADQVINKVREMIDFFSDIAESDTLAGLLASLKQELEGEIADKVDILGLSVVSGQLCQTYEPAAQAEEETGE